MKYLKLPGTNGAGSTLTATSSAQSLLAMIRASGSDNNFNFGNENAVCIYVPAGQTDVRYYADGNDPTTALGKLVKVGDTVWDYGVELNKVKIISTGANSAFSLYVGTHSIGMPSDSQSDGAVTLEVGDVTIGDVGISGTGGEDLVADNAAAPVTDYPLPVGGQYNATLPTYADGDRAVLQQNASGELLVTGAGGVGIPPYTHSSARGDFNATYASSTTLTVAGGPTLASKNLVFLKVTDSSDVTSIFVNGSDDVSLSVSGGIVTIAGAGTPLATGDTYDLGVNLQDKGYDKDLDHIKTGVENTEWAHYTSIEHIIDEANVAAATYRKEFTATGYRDFSFHLNGSGGVTFTIWATNDDTTDETSDTGWIDISSSILGSVSLVDDSGIYFIDTQQMPLKYMIKYVASDATNAVDAWIRKY